jgi:ankyrin repeat protein
MDNLATTHAICGAIEKNDVDTFKQLLGHNDDEIINNAMIFIKLPQHRLDHITHCPFLLCAEYHRYEMLQYLLNIPGIDINQKDTNGHNALMKIVWSKNFDNLTNQLNCAMLFLSNANFNVNSVDIYRNTVFMWALTDNTRYAIVKAMLKRSEIDVNFHGDMGNTAIMFASTSSINVRLMLRNANVHINTTNHRGDTALHVFSRVKSNIHCIRQLLNHPDINVNIVNNRNTTALSETLVFDKFFTHAMLIHGRL